MPTLNWIGRKAVENHHRQLPFHLLKEVLDLSIGGPGTGNLLIEGDNVLALGGDEGEASKMIDSATQSEKGRA